MRPGTVPARRELRALAASPVTADQGARYLHPRRATASATASIRSSDSCRRLSRPDPRIPPHRAPHAPTSVSPVFPSSPGHRFRRPSIIPCRLEPSPRDQLCREGSTDDVRQGTAARAGQRGVCRGDFLSPSRWWRVEGLSRAARSDYGTAASMGACSAQAQPVSTPFRASANAAAPPARRNDREPARAPRRRTRRSARATSPASFALDLSRGARTPHPTRRLRSVPRENAACLNTTSRRAVISPRAAERSWSNICSSAAHRSSRSASDNPVPLRSSAANGADT